MAGASLLMLLDDIASILDDVSVMSQMAAKKTAGVIGDDLALNAYQVNGVSPDRELPVVWAVARGSLLNKAILVPAALLISAFIPWAITPLLMLGGAFLCFEGAEKLLHRFLHRGAASHEHAETVRAAADSTVDMVAHERDKIRGAVRTDFILSAEIIIITLGVVAHNDLPTQVTVLIAIALAMTVGVYGLVAGIVKFDDAGLYLSQRAGATAGARAARRVGHGILRGAPWLLKGLTVIGTVAMFLVGGGILLHGVPALGHWVGAIAPDGFAGVLFALVADGLWGLLVGTLLALGVALFGALRRAAA
jgi:predicted DNA repair protein MutK